MANVKFAIGSSSNLTTVQKDPGQILVTKDKDYLELYVDYDENGETIRKKFDVDKGVDITWAQYQALSEAEKNNGTIYFIVDQDPDTSTRWKYVALMEGKYTLLF